MSKEIDDYLLLDHPDGKAHYLSYCAAVSQASLRDRVLALVKKFLPEHSSHIQELAKVSILRYLGHEYVTGGLNLLNYGMAQSKSSGIAIDKVVLVTQWAKFFKELEISSHLPGSIDVAVMSQPFAIHSIPSYLWRVLSLAGYIVIEYASMFRNSIIANPTKINEKQKTIGSLAHIGQAAVYGFDGNLRSDLFWGDYPGLDSERIYYLFDRPDLVASRKQNVETSRRGLRMAVLRSSAMDDWAARKGYGVKIGFGKLLRILGYILRSSVQGLLSDWFRRIVLMESVYAITRARYLADQYLKLGIKGVFHYSDCSHDIVSIAAEMSGGVHFGVHSSLASSPDECSMRANQVYFYWGEHFANIGRDSYSSSKTVLLSGSIINSGVSEDVENKLTTQIDSLRAHGCEHFVVLFDSSAPALSMLEIFFKWLIEEPKLGLLVKSKFGDAWDNVLGHGLGGVAETAHDTGRLAILDSCIPPAAVSKHVDFSVGVGSPSAVISSALAGAKSIYLDIEKSDHSDSLLHAYSRLHTLGSKRCVFYDPRDAKKALVSFFENPDENSSLGDMSPLLEQFDPFCDQRAGERVGAYIYWYLQGLDAGKNRNESLAFATEQYARQWGKNAVVSDFSDKNGGW